MKYDVYEAPGEHLSLSRPRCIYTNKDTHDGYTLPATGTKGGLINPNYTWGWSPPSKLYQVKLLCLFVLRLILLSHILGILGNVIENEASTSWSSLGAFMKQVGATNHIWVKFGSSPKQGRKKLHIKTWLKSPLSYRGHSITNPNHELRWNPSKWS